MEQDIRWQQRFTNFEKALLFLQKACEQETLTPLEEVGLIQSFEFTFELAWKTLKDYLMQEGLTPRFPREVIKDAFQMELIEDGTTWLKMLEKRNELSHTYNEEQALKAVKIVREEYLPCLRQIYHHFKKCTD